MEQQKREGDNKIRKVFQNEIIQVIGIVSIVFSFVSYVIVPIKTIEQEIMNIKNNHLHTIEMNMAEVKTLNQKNVDENTNEHMLIMEQLTKTATILDQHLVK